jgi:hypothetical protein
MRAAEGVRSVEPWVAHGPSVVVAGAGKPPGGRVNQGTWRILKMGTDPGQQGSRSEVSQRRPR